tara:strand:- start:229 stop:483 length:255 start_codon:yes stop_codon:yes gene_type:complete
MTEQELLAQLDEQNRIIREQRSHMVLLEEKLRNLDDMYCLKVLRAKRYSIKLELLKKEIERLREIQEEQDLIKELREKYKPVTK